MPIHMRHASAMTKLGRPSVWSEHREEMVRMYEQDKMSRGEIARHFETSVQTVTRQLTTSRVLLEDRQRNPNAGRTAEEQGRINAKVSASRKGKGTGPIVRHLRVSCDECGIEFEVIPSKTGKRFCSREHRTAFLARANHKQAVASYKELPKLCPCGVEIPFEYRHTRQFCSPACRSEFAPKRQADSTKQITFDCGTCRKEVMEEEVQR